MVESLLTISMVGLAAGFVFSMPIAGPISILITSHGLRGQLRYCMTAALGASIVDLLVCFFAVHGFTRLFGVFANIIPYILLGGSIVLFIVGIRIIRTRLDFEHIDQKESGLKRIIKIKDKSGFWTGFLLNASNPSIFFGWLMSSFVIISFVASMGLNVGGLDQMLGNNIAAAKNMTRNSSTAQSQKHSITTPTAKELKKTFPQTKDALNDLKQIPKHFRLFFSLCYAFFVALGTIVWFSLFSYILVRYREKININIITRLIKVLGIVLCGFAVYLMGHAAGFFMTR